MKSHGEYIKENDKKKVKLESNSNLPEQLVEEPDVSKRYIDQVI